LGSEVEMREPIRHKRPRKKKAKHVQCTNLQKKERKRQQHFGFSKGKTH